MNPTRFVTVVTLASFLSAGLAHPALAAPSGDPAPAPSPLRASIDRVSAQTVPQAIPARRSGEVRKQMTGGRGGGGMMLMSLVLTAASLAGTYYMVKEMKKASATTTAGFDGGVAGRRTP